MPIGTPEQHYSHFADGTWGEFESPAGRVGYLLTTAQLGSQASASGQRLMRLLHPPREILSIEDMTFEELLQRDIDDYRVLTNLVPYILTPEPEGPAFFPPILCILLPFEGREPTSDLPPASDERPIEDGGMSFRRIEYGPYLAFEHLVTPEGSPHPIDYGRVRWNDEVMKLVIIDGQHRAMALLAIDRTQRDAWADSTGTEYRHFYEPYVRQMLEETTVELEKIQFPVAICWFPDASSSGGDPHRAARKLFIDVNKEARPPSESRLILLSDSDLRNIFTRRLLDRLKDVDNPHPMPLAAVEYDHPERNVRRPDRWSVFTNILILRECVRVAVFGPPYLVRDVTQWDKPGPDPETDMNDFMRSQLSLGDFLPEVIADGETEFRRELIGNEDFPRSELDRITGAFMSSWGEGILHLLSGLHPYKSHWRALELLSEDWDIEDDFIARLAKEAIFGGTGTYWTLEASVEAADSNQSPITSDSDLVKAWNVLKRRRSQFEELRAARFIGEDGSGTVEAELVREVNQYFTTLNTFAAQMGLVSAVASLLDYEDTDHSEVLETIRKLVDAWNEALWSDAASGRKRFWFLNRREDPALNQTSNMNASFGRYFRYLWLEILRVEEARTILGDELHDQVASLAIKGRKDYLGQLTRDMKRTLRDADPELAQDPDRLEETARRRAGEALAEALEVWSTPESAELQLLRNPSSGEQDVDESDDY